MSINLLPPREPMNSNKKLIILLISLLAIFLISVIYQFSLRAEIKQQQRKISNLVQQQNKLSHNNSSSANKINKKSETIETIAPTLQSQHIFLHYANANDMGTLLQSKTHRLLSEQGTAVADIRTNSLWIRDAPDKLRDIETLLKNLDIATPQILITAKIVSVDESCMQNLGIELGTANTSTDALTMDLSSTELQSGRLSVAIAKTGDGKLLEMELNALETEGHANVISNPKLLTENRQTAFIESGQEIPYQEQTTSGATNTAFKKAVLSLKVTPELLTADKLLLRLNVNQDKVSAIEVNGVPAIDTEQLSTQVEVENNQTIILGGIYQEDTHVTTQRIPFLSNLPGVGALFRSKETSQEKKELLIFVTPTIVSNRL